MNTSLSNVLTQSNRWELYLDPDPAWAEEVTASGVFCERCSSRRLAVDLPTVRVISVGGNRRAAMAFLAGWVAPFLAIFSDELTSALRVIEPRLAVTPVLCNGDPLPFKAITAPEELWVRVRKAEDKPPEERFCCPVCGLVGGVSKQAHERGMPRGHRGVLLSAGFMLVVDGHAKEALGRKFSKSLRFEEVIPDYADGRRDPP